MCLGIPMQIRSIDGLLARCEAKGVEREANLLMLEKVCELCHVPPDRHLHNVGDYGITAGAGSIGVISMRWDDWTDDDDIAVAGVGAGLTWSSFLLRFGGRP